MERRKNIILFTGPNTVFLEKDLKAWRDIFVEKHGEINLMVSYPWHRDPAQTLSECLTPGFFWGSRLIVLHGIPEWSDELSDKSQKSSNSALAGLLLENLENIPDTNYILFICSQPDKRKKLYKTLLKEATVKEYPEASPNEIIAFINSVLTIEPIAARKLASKKGNDLAAISQELKKLKLYRPKDMVTADDIDQYVTWAMENRIFDVLDALLSSNPNTTKQQLEVLLGNENVFLVYSSLLANLRKIIYACMLSLGWYSDSSISGDLGIHPFIIQKNAHLKRDIDSVIKLYQNLLDHEHAAKTWLTAWGSEPALAELLEAEALRYCQSQ